MSSSASVLVCIAYVAVCHMVVSCCILLKCVAMSNFVDGKMSWISLSSRKQKPNKNEREKRKTATFTKPRIHLILVLNNWDDYCDNANNSMIIDVYLNADDDCVGKHIASNLDELRMRMDEMFYLISNKWKWWFSLRLVHLKQSIFTTQCVCLYVCVSQVQLFNDWHIGVC